MKSHTIKLKINDDGGVTAYPPEIHFAIGDTLSFTTDRGKPKVEFDPPDALSSRTFEEGDEKAPPKFVKASKVAFRCSIDLGNGEVLGWAKNRDEKSGAEGVP